MPEEDREKIQEILGRMECPENFKCAESGFESICKARDFGDDERLECIERDDPPCRFARVWNHGFEMRFCECPLRVYLAKHLER